VSAYQKKTHLRSTKDNRITICGIFLTSVSVIDDPAEATCMLCLRIHGTVPRAVPSRSVLAARWTKLREHIQQERAARDIAAADHSEIPGHESQTERAYGRVEALDALLATMDRMEAGQ
jgi:hypothetical protein